MRLEVVAGACAGGMIQKKWDPPPPPQFSPSPLHAPVLHQHQNHAKGPVRIHHVELE